MNILVNYSTFKDVIEDIRISITEEQYITILPIEVSTVVDGNEIVENKIQIKYFDEQISYEENVNLTRKESIDLIRVLQQLNTQIK